jgi:hypothetical protein
MFDGCRLRRHQQEEEQLDPAEDEEEQEEEESEYETDSEEEGFGRALLKPVFVPKVCSCDLALQLQPAGYIASVSRLCQAAARTLRYTASPSLRVKWITSRHVTIAQCWYKMLQQPQCTRNLLLCCAG